MIKKITIFSLLMIFILVSGFGCKTTDPQTQAAVAPIILTFWQAYDDTDAFTEIISKYEALHPNITVEYRKLRYEEYENELLNSWAEDRGPDIFAIQNTWVKKYQTKISPMPASITMAYMVPSGTFQKTLVPQLKTVSSLTVRDLKNTFADVVASDVVLDDGKIYGLPLSVDTLALFYNRDLLNNAGITSAPKFWNKEFQQSIKKLSKQDPKRGLVQSGIALGTSKNISRFSDILSVLMMQNGATMSNDTQILFQTIPQTMSNGYNPGLEALRFYTDFANPAKEVYSWNNDMPNSVEAFASGNLAMFFGYSFNLSQIRAQSPKLNFGISQLPQIEGNPMEINFANYWVDSVSKKSKYPNESWDFIQFLTKEENAKLYLEKTKKPTALKSLIDTQKNDEDLGVFAEQILSAKSWYHGKSVSDAESAMGEMIDLAANASDRLEEILREGASKIQQTLN
ncbi:MAG: extracellular solute-binding protein [Candidatus Falkowbacteria bacterium]